MKEYFSLGVSFYYKEIYVQGIDGEGYLEIESVGFEIKNKINDVYFVSFFNTVKNDISFYEKEELEKASKKTQTQDERFIDLIFHKNDSVQDIKNQIEEVILLKEII